MANNPSNKIKSELIDEVILRLLGLNPGTELDYQTYHDILKKKLAISRLGGKELPEEEDILLRDELKRVRKEKDKGIRFKIKKVKAKVSSKQNQVSQKRLQGTGSIVKSKTSKITSQNIIQVSVKDITEAYSANFTEVKKTLDSILQILSSKFKFDQKQIDKDRKEKESEKRGKKESTLEGFKKGISGIVAATKKMLSPFQSVIDRIKRFVFFTLLGKAFTKFMEWMNDKGNREKFNAFVEFLSDHWPALAGLYILFGTSFGKLVRGLLKGATRMIVALAMNIGKIKNFVTKHKRLAFATLALAPLASRELGNIFGENRETPESGLIPKTDTDLDGAKKSTDQAKETNVPKFNFGGLVPKFNFGGMLPSFSIGGMDLQNGIPITGAGSDNTLIAAKTGEAILTERDQQDINQNYVNKFTGQPLNIPQYLAGRKPGSVSLDNLRFPGFGGGFSDGGLIPGFNNGGIIGGISRLFNKPQSTEKAGPRLTPDMVRGSLKRQPQQLTKSAQSLIDQKWSYASRGGDATNGCAPAINEVYRRAGIPIPWSKVARPNYVPDIYKSLNSKFMKINEGERKPGDIVIWKDTGYPPGSGQEPYGHIGIVMPDGRIANNSSSKGTFTNLNSPQEAKSWWPNTKELIYFRSPSISQNFIASSKRVNQKSRSVVKSQSLFASLSGSLFKRQGGGVFDIKESTGMNIPGATADRQLINLAVQPGERGYILPKGSVDKGIVPIIDRLVAMTDSDSTPFKQGANRKIPNITPYGTSGIGGMMTLPPIIQNGLGGTKARASGYSGGSQVPSFSHIPDFNDRSIIAKIYGIEEVI